MKTLLKTAIMVVAFISSKNIAAQEKSITFSCASEASKSCLTSSLKAGNVKCDAKNKGTIDFLKLANNFTNETKPDYTKEVAIEQEWIKAKLSSIKSCITEKSLSQKLSNDDNNLISQLDTIQQSSFVASCNPQNIAQNLNANIQSKTDLKTSINKTSEIVAACASKLTTAINTNQKAEIREIKDSLTSIKTSLENQTNEIIWLSNQKIGKLDVSEALKANSTSKGLIQKINTLLGTSGDEFLIPSWRDVSLSYQFYTGIEYNNVNSLFSESTVRLGLLTYLRLGKEVERLRQNNQGECDLEFRCGSLWYHVPHVYGNFVVTGASESAAGVTDNNSDDSNNGNNETSSNSDDFDAIEYELGIFYPIYLGSRGSKSAKTYQEHAFGLIATAGGRITDTNDNFQDRYYGGFRFSSNEETYFDFMYGKSEPLKGRRIELRGQLPVYKMGTGRLFIGGSANIEVSKKAKNDEGQYISEADAFKVYVTWQTTFDDIWKGIGGDEN
ncbi:hypothetical protein RS130_01555 [Paraglaciecola aquimarina]|uniref:Uncharacterized protein n=1 Tax=Paraglaciecola aquimarina TaxID=1235557 RepID=A0ABU3SRZ2_9ALTE|nr:hypothetical protein [Paraglaciecola aquimarina]MDU0352783.1 hypothetical protein [Paraglaciecola aquimarina]